MAQNHRTTVTLEARLLPAAEVRIRDEALDGMSHLVNRALEAYLARPVGAFLGDPLVGTVAGEERGAAAVDPAFLAQVREQTEEVRRLLPVATISALGLRDLQEQLDDLTVAIGRRIGASRAPEQGQAKSRT
ncbi:hypothetical protein ACFQX4_17800 [Roseomonas sp. GCM10028921]